MTMATGRNSQDGADPNGAVCVSILGQEYPIRSGIGADYIREIAQNLDARMRTIRQLEPARPPLRIAILAALNLTDEVLTLRREREQLARQLETKLRQIGDELDRSLQDTRQ